MRLPHALQETVDRQIVGQTARDDLLPQRPVFDEQDLAVFLFGQDPDRTAEIEQLPDQRLPFRRDAGVCRYFGHLTPLEARSRLSSSGVPLTKPLLEKMCSIRAFVLKMSISSVS